jgi:hypothetical protein
MKPILRQSQLNAELISMEMVEGYGQKKVA